MDGSGSATSAPLRSLRLGIPCEARTVDALDLHSQTDFAVTTPVATQSILLCLLTVPGSSRREVDWWATVDQDSIGERVVKMASRWRLTESAIMVRLADKDVVDSNKINGWLSRPIVHGAGMH